MRIGHRRAGISGNCPMISLTRTSQRDVPTIRGSVRMRPIQPPVQFAARSGSCKDPVMRSSQIQLDDLRLDLFQMGFDQGPFPRPEPMERFGHEIITNSEAGQRAFNALDNRG